MRSAATSGCASCRAYRASTSSAANRALQRYPHPGGISADTLIETTFTFGIQYQMR